MLLTTGMLAGSRPEGGRKEPSGQVARLNGVKTPTPQKEQVRGIRSEE